MPARQIVIGFDGSEDSRRAVAWGAALAGAEPGTRLCLVHALAMPAIPVRPSGADLAHLLDRQEEAMRAALEDVASDLRAAGHPVEIVLRRWLPAETLLEVAADRAADLVAVGTHGAGRARLLLGTVSSEVARLAHAPVLVARGRKPVATPRRVLLAVDGSVHSIRAVRAALRWCPQATLLAVHVASGDAALSAAELADALAAAGAAGASLEAHIVPGHPAATLLELADREGADLIAAGTRGSGPLAELLLGGVSDKLLQLAPCPVLLAR